MKLKDILNSQRQTQCKGQVQIIVKEGSQGSVLEIQSQLLHLKKKSGGIVRRKKKWSESGVAKTQCKARKYYMVQEKSL